MVVLVPCRIAGPRSCVPVRIRPPCLERGARRGAVSVPAPGATGAHDRREGVCVCVCMRARACSLLAWESEFVTVSECANAYQTWPRQFTAGDAATIRATASVTEERLSVVCDLECACACVCVLVFVCEIGRAHV